MRASRLVLLVPMLLVAACATPGGIAEQSAKANVGVEQAQNRMLVLNALRAAKRRPMYFTSVVSLTMPTPRVTPSIGIGIPLNGDASGAAIATTALRAEVPTFNVAVLDSQKFMTGITTPLRPTLVRYYLDQGWPAMVFLSLVVREIEYSDDRVGEVSYINYPGNRRDFEAFQGELRAMVACGLRLVEEDVVAGLESPAFRLPESTGLLSALASTAREGLVVVPRKDAAGRPTGEWQLARPRSDVLVVFATPDAPACRALPAEQRRRFLQSNAAPSARKGAVMDVPGPAGPSRTLRLMVRSPEAILYYLGELVRAEEEGGYVPMTTIDLASGRRAAIFKVTRTGPLDAFSPPEAFVSVEYDGVQYSVDSGPDDRSSQALSLVSLLIGLQKEASEVPITAPIRLLGQ